MSRSMQETGRLYRKYQERDWDEELESTAEVVELLAYRLNKGIGRRRVVFMGRVEVNS